MTIFTSSSFQCFFFFTHNALTGGEIHIQLSASEPSACRPSLCELWSCLYCPKVTALPAYQFASTHVTTHTHGTRQTHGTTHTHIHIRLHIRKALNETQQIVTKTAHIKAEMSNPRNHQKRKSPHTCSAEITTTVCG